MTKKQFKKQKLGKFTKWLGVYFVCLIISGMSFGGVFGSALRFIAFIPVLIWLYDKHTVKMTPQIKFTLIFVLICFMTVYWSVDFDKSISRVVSHLLFFTMLVSVSSYNYTNDELNYLKKCLINSSRISAIVLLLTGKYTDGRLLLNGAIIEDPNYLCGYFLFAISASIMNLISKKVTYKYKIISAMEILVYIYITFATGSRGGLLSMISTIIFMIVFNNGFSKNVIRKTVVVLLVLFVSAYYIVPLLSDTILKRFTIQTILESNGTGRFDLWKSAITTFKNSNVLRQLFGYGTATSKTLIYTFSPYRYSVYHNVFFDNLVEIGVVGLLSYVIHIGSFLVNSIKSKQIYNFSILVGMIVLSLSTSTYTFKPYWNILLYIACWANMRNDDDETINSD